MRALEKDRAAEKEKYLVQTRESGETTPQHKYTGEKLLYIAKMSQGRWKRKSKGVFRKEIQVNGKY